MSFLTDLRRELAYMIDPDTDTDDVKAHSVRISREAAELEPDKNITSMIRNELSWCEKETAYLVGGSNHFQAEWRIGRIRSRVHEINAMLDVLSRRVDE